MANKKEAWGREEDRTSVALDYRATLKQNLEQREQRYQKNHNMHSNADAE